MQNTVKVYPSLSGLIFLIRRGMDWKDDGNSIYFFGSSRGGFEQTMKNCAPPSLGWDSFLAALDKAEAEGRLQWRPGHIQYVYEGAHDRHLWLAEKLASMGVELASQPSQDDGSPGWNIPALREWLEANAPSVKFMD